MESDARVPLPLGGAGGGVKRLAVLAATLAASCVRAPPPDLSRDPEALLGQVRAAQSRVRSVRGPASVSLESPRQSGSFDAWLAAEKPERLHIEVLDFFGNPSLVLVTSDGRFGLLDVSAAVYYRGAATPENLSRVLPFSLPASELATLLCGSAPLVDGAAAAAEPEGDAMRLLLAGPEGRESLAVGEGAAVREATLEPRGAPASFWRVTFGSFEPRGGVPWPAQADFRTATARVTVHWKRGVEVNPPAGPSPFSLEPPRGVRVQDLSPGEAPRLELPKAPQEKGAPAG